LIRWSRETPEWDYLRSCQPGWHAIVSAKVAFNSCRP
jgi:hypothetical protein